MITLLPAYSITIKVGEKLFAGHVDNSLSIVPNYEPVLRKATGGRFDLDFVSVDLDMQISGLTYARGDAEAATHNDYADLRAACNNVTQVAFVYGDMTPGKVVMVGYAKLSEYQETTGSGKISGQWSCRLKSVRGSVQEEVVPPAVQDVKYGLLYNWYAAVDPRGICAEGWHIGANAEYGTLMRYLDPTGLNNNNTAGGKLKEIGFVYWSSPNTDATNEAGANFRGSAARIVGGNFQNLNTQCRIWHTDAINSASAFHSVLNNNSGIFLTWYSGSGSGGAKYFGESLRPIKDSTALLHGESGIYVGNNGRAYRTICIGTQELLADNLCETLFRTGELIPEVTDNASWAALTTAGICAYNNDWSNV